MTETAAAFANVGLSLLGSSNNDTATKLQILSCFTITEEVLSLVNFDVNK